MAENPNNPNKGPENNGIPEWYWNDRGGMMGESKLATGYEQVKAVNCMVQLAELQDPRERQKYKEVPGGAEAVEAEVKKELNRYFKMAIGAGQDNVLSVAGMLERLSEPSPWLAQREVSFFDTADKALTSLARYHDGNIPEVILPWFRRLDETLTQQRGIQDFLLAAGATTPGYYDALELIGKSLIDRQRFHTSMVDVRSGLAAEDPGITSTLTDEQKRHIENTFAETEPRREQIRMMDDARLIINATASIAQADIVDGSMVVKADGSKERKAVPMEIDPKQELFVKYLFGDTDKSKWVTYKAKDWDGNDKEITTPKDIEVWYADSDRISTREKWLSKMLVAVEWKDKTTGLGIWPSLKSMSEAQIESLARTFDQEATKVRMKIGDKLTNATFERGASKLANVSWLQLDKAFITSGRLGWKFVYKTDSNGVVRRYKDSGGIYKAFDNYFGIYTWEKYLSYKATWKSTTQFFIASADWMRKEKMKHRPDWMPSLKEWLPKDPRMQLIYNTLFDAKYKNFRARRIVGDMPGKKDYIKAISAGQAPNLKDPNIKAYADALAKAMPMADLDPKIAKYLQENSYAYVTAYKNAQGENICVPMFMPTELEFMNFWHNVRIKNGPGSGSTAKSESIWEKWMRGVKPSEINYDEVNYEAIDRLWVGGNMLARFQKFWLDPYEAERDPFLAGFFKDAGTQSVSELSKRIFLAFRDLPIDYKNLIAAIVPQSIALYEAHQTGLLGTSLGTPDGEEILNQWNFRMAKWFRAFRWLPNVMYDEENLYMEKAEMDANDEIIKNMGNDLALILVNQKMTMERVGQAVFAADKDSLTKPFNDFIELVDDPDVAKALAREGGEPELKDRGVKRKTFEVRSEDDIERKFFNKR